jgi:Flp pilus assembly protein TadG
MIPRSIKSILIGRVKRFWCGETLCKLIVREDGAAAIEFAVVSIPFLALLFAILESGIIFLANQTLESAAATAGRLILTGQVQAALTQNPNYDFHARVCESLPPLFSCNKVYVDVQTATSFSAANTGAPIKNGAWSVPLDNQGNPKFNIKPGGPGDIVVMRVMYQWPVYVSLLNLANTLSNMNGNMTLLMATTVFRNEPFAPVGG